MEKADIYDRLLKKYWKHNKLKSLQKQIIKAVVEEKNDLMAILSTGYGKSVCYQLPFLVAKKKKCVLVISPLIALMEDQKQSLNDKGIPVASLNSSMKSSLRDMIMSNISDGENKILYMSPEFTLKNEEFITDLYEDDRLLFVAIDEAHCVSSWGNDFRPDYQALSCLKNWMPEVNIMALTATATEKVRDDIAESLGLEEYYEFISSFDRKNLYIECKLRTTVPEDDFAEYINEYRDKSCIVYVRTRDHCQKISDMLVTQKILSEPYHAGLSATLRQTTQDKFISGEVKWIVATVAFGMGIDRAVELVIHYGSPGDMESYYQEIGRAGRSGAESKCIMMYGKDDMRINRILLKDIKDIEYKQYREAQIRNMSNFLRTGECRRKVLLKYFGEKYGKDNCNKCDNCTKTTRVINGLQHDLQYPMFMFKSFMMYTGINGGPTKLLNVLMGKKLAAIKDYHNSVFFGLGKRYDIKFWKCIIEICIHNGYLLEETIPSGFGVVLRTTDKLKNWYKILKPILKEKKIKSFDYDNYLTVTIEDQNSHENYDLPGTCLDIDKYIRKRTMTSIESIIYDEDLLEDVN